MLRSLSAYSSTRIALQQRVEEILALIIYYLGIIIYLLTK